MVFAIVQGMGCGPSLATEGGEADDEFLARAEASVTGVCVNLEACEERLEDMYLKMVVGPYRNGICYEPLLGSTSRIYEGDRCTDPETMLALYDCIAALECPTLGSQREECRDEYEAVEVALCYPF